MQLFSIKKADEAKLPVELMEETMLNLKKEKFAVVTQDKIIKLI